MERERRILTTNDVRSIFNTEFSPVASHFFPPFELNIEQIRRSNDPNVCNPGVYVYCHPIKGVIRVGVSMVNSRKRALQHIDKNTGGIMKELSNDESTRILLFNIINEEKDHWVKALERYFEKEKVLDPLIPPGRK